MAASKKVNGKSSKSPLDHALEIARKAKADAVNIPKKPVAVKGKKTVPAALDWGNGIPEDKLAYLNDEEMALLQAHRMFKGKRSYKGVPAFPDPKDTAAGEAGVTSGTTSGTTMGGGGSDSDSGGLGQGGQGSGSTSDTSGGTSTSTSGGTSTSGTSSAAPASSSTTAPGTEDDDTSAAAPTSPDIGGQDTGGTSATAPSAPAPTATSPAPSTTYSSPVTSAPSSVSTEGTLDRLSSGTSIISNPSNQPIDKDQSKVPTDPGAGTSYSTTQTIKAPSYTSGANSPFADESVTAYDPEDNVDMTGANSPFASPDVSQYDTEQYGLGPAATSPFAPKNPNEGLGASPAAPSVYSGTIPQDPAIQGVADLANQNYKTVQSGPYVSRAYSDPDLVTPSAPGSIPAPMNVPGMSYGNPATPGTPGAPDFSGYMTYQGPIYDMTYGPQRPQKQIYDRVAPYDPTYGPQLGTKENYDRIPPEQRVFPGAVSPGGFTTPDLSSPVDTTGGNSPLSDESVQSYDPNAAPTVTRSVPAAPSFPTGELGQITEDEAAAIYGDSSLAGLPALTGVSPPVTNITAGYTKVSPDITNSAYADPTVENALNVAREAGLPAGYVGPTTSSPPISLASDIADFEVDPNIGLEAPPGTVDVAKEYRSPFTGLSVTYSRFADPVIANTTGSFLGEERAKLPPYTQMGNVYAGPTRPFSPEGPYNPVNASDFMPLASEASLAVPKPGVSVPASTAAAPDKFSNAVKVSTPSAPTIVPASGPVMFSPFPGNDIGIVRGSGVSPPYINGGPLIGFTPNIPHLDQYGNISGSYDDSLYGAQLQSPEEPSYGQFETGEPSYNMVASAPTVNPFARYSSEGLPPGYADTYLNEGTPAPVRTRGIPAVNESLPPATGDESVGGETISETPEDVAPAAPSPAAPVAPVTSVTAPEEDVDVAPYDPYAQPTDQYVAPVDPYTLGDLAQPTNWTDAQRQAYMDSYASTSNREPYVPSGGRIIRPDNDGGFNRRGRFGRNRYRGEEREFIPYDYLSTDYATLPPPPNPNITTYNDYSYYPYNTGGKVGDSVDAALRLARQSVVNRNKTR